MIRGGRESEKERKRVKEKELTRVPQGPQGCMPGIGELQLVDDQLIAACKWGVSIAKVVNVLYLSYAGHRWAVIKYLFYSSMRP